jgi:hypothetical protein
MAIGPVSRLISLGLLAIAPLLIGAVCAVRAPDFDEAARQVVVRRLQDEIVEDNLAVTPFAVFASTATPTPTFTPTFTPTINANASDGSGSRGNNDPANDGTNVPQPDDIIQPTLEPEPTRTRASTRPAPPPGLLTRTPSSVLPQLPTATLPARPTTTRKPATPGSEPTATARSESPGSPPSTATATGTSTPTPSPTNTPTNTATPTNTPTPTDTATPTPTPVIPVVSFSAAAYSVTEGDGTATLTATLNTSTTVTVSVSYSTGDDTAFAPNDYTAISGTLNFVPGQTEQNFFVTIVEDNVDDPDSEIVQLELTGPTNATLGSDQATLTINDNDPIPVIEFVSTSYSVLESGVPTFTVILDRPSGKTINFSYGPLSGAGTATSPADYTSVFNVRTLTPNSVGVGPTSATVSWGGLVNDGIAEPLPNETIVIELSGASNAVRGTNYTATLEIIDDD